MNKLKKKKKKVDLGLDEGSAGSRDKFQVSESSRAAVLVLVTF